MIVALNDRPDVVAMVPTLGRDKGRLSACLQSVVAQTGDARIAIICVANGGDPTPVLPPLTTLLTPGLNLGWAGGLSLARSIARAELLWMVQDDMTLNPDCLEALRSALTADPGLAYASPAAVDDAGNIPASSLGGILSRETPIRLLEWLPAESAPPHQIEGLDRLDYIAGRGALVRAAAWDAAGGPDPRFYPVVWCDVDFCTALRAQGWRFAMVPDALARHQRTGSTPGAYGEFLFARNNRRFDEKWGTDSRTPVRDTAPDAGVPTTLLADIAVAASGALSELAVAYAAVRADFERADREIDELRRSNSWRLTAPVRRISVFLRRRPR